MLTLPLQDWNGQLLDPAMKHLAPNWEKTFTRSIPSALAGLARDASNLLRHFHKDVSDRASMTGSGIAQLGMLHSQLSNYEEAFKELGRACQEKINGQKREINREFVPVVAEAMEPAYEACARESGMLILTDRWGCSADKD